ncbi:MAG: squalene/phytoene synthase family protein [Nitrospirota bacterium]|nr:squalene/phytoene synthase family protein [Nitrospirota bacterium]
MTDVASASAPAAAARAPVTSAEAQACCTAVTRAAGSSFYYAFLPMARPRREAMFVIYAFCRHADDIVDESDDAGAAARELEAWRAETRQALSGEAGAVHPILQRLAEVVREYGIDPGLPFVLLDGMAMDLEGVNYPDFAALSRYCYRVASVVGLMCIRVFGCTDPAAERFAVAHGMAFQLTNIVRDVARDAAMGRVYLPEDDMARLGVSRAAVLGGRFADPELRRLLALLRDRAEGFYDEAAAIARALPTRERRLLLPSRIMGSIYRALLDEIAGRDYRIEPLVTVSAPRKLLLAGRAFLDHLLDRW